MQKIAARKKGKHALEMKTEKKTSTRMMCERVGCLAKNGELSRVSMPTLRPLRRYTLQVDGTMDSIRITNDA